jgi:hypothetical protein
MPLPSSFTSKVIPSCERSIPTLAVLNDAEKGQGEIAGQAVTESRRQIHTNFDCAALGESVHIPAERRFQTHFIEQRRVKKVGHGTNFFRGLLE